MNTSLHATIFLATIALALVPSFGFSQTIRTFDNNNNVFQQEGSSLSVLNTTFNFLGGNDRLILLRDDDLAGLGSGTANMGDGRDVVLTSFNMSGTFNLGGGNDLFLCQGDVNFNGNATDILVLAGAGNDIIAVDTDFCDYRGEAGNDFFFSDGSRNSFDGGPGNDTYSAEDATSAVGMDLGQGVVVVGSATPDFLSGIENLRGSNFDDEILGDPNANRIDGLGGNDLIDGDAGNDTIAGGPGGNGLFGNAGIDTLVISGTITSKTRLSPTAIRVTGLLNGIPFDDEASDFEQVLDNNVLKSVAFFMGESTTNVVSQTVIPETSVLTLITGLVAGRTLNGNGAANVLNGGPGHDDISGFGGSDTLNGNGGDDTILGGAGDDTLNGGPGLDRLTGGPGRDSFSFTSPLAGSADVLTDYRVIDDTIRISRNLVGGLAAGPLADSRFKNTARGTVDADDRIIYDSATGALHFDRNGSVTGGRVLIATLPRGLAMVASEIIIQ